MGYNDTKKMILDTLMGRPVGTEIQPEDQQAYELSMLDYIRSIELISNGGFAGYATTVTVPVQPEATSVYYISLLQSGEDSTFDSFIGQDGNPLFVAGTSSSFVILLWNGRYWTSYVLFVSGGGGGNLFVKTNYGLGEGGVATIDILDSNTLYIYENSLTSLSVASVSEAWSVGSLAHIQFTSGSSMSISYGSSGIIKFNSETLPIANKKHEISILGLSAILSVGN